MFCGLEKLSENQYKCYKYSLFGEGVKKQDREKYVIIIIQLFTKHSKKNVMNIFGTIIATKLGVWEACFLTIAEKTQL